MFGRWKCAWYEAKKNPNVEKASDSRESMADRAQCDHRQNGHTPQEWPKEQPTECDHTDETKLCNTKHDNRQSWGQSVFTGIDSRNHKPTTAVAMFRVRGKHANKVVHSPPASKHACYNADSVSAEQRQCAAAAVAEPWLAWPWRKRAEETICLCLCIAFSNSIG